MNRFLFNRAEYDRIYNCSMLPEEEWYKYGRKNLPMGIFFIAAGVVYELYNFCKDTKMPRPLYTSEKWRFSFSKHEKIYIPFVFLIFLYNIIIDSGKPKYHLVVLILPYPTVCRSWLDAFYIPVIMAMLREEFFSIPSYKMMFTVGVIDAITLLEICFMDGYDTIFGGVFCTDPTRFYIFGVISTFGWFTGTFIGILLALNRCFEIFLPLIAELLFKGKRTWLWLFGCFLYGSYAFWFQYPFLYHSGYMAVFYDPHFGDPYRQPFSNPAYYAHNLFVAAAIGTLYSIICIGWFLKYKQHNAEIISLSQRLINIQSAMISCEILGAGLIYIYFMNFYVPSFCFVLGHILWQMSHGDDGILIFLINKNMRRAVIKTFQEIFCCDKRNQVSVVTKHSLIEQKFMTVTNKVSVMRKSQK